MSDQISIRDKFNAKLEDLRNKKGANVTLLMQEHRYNDILMRVMELRNAGVLSKTKKDYYLLRKFDILEVIVDNRTVIKLKKKNTEQRFVYAEEVFDVINTIHLAKGHAGRDIMVKEINKVYANVTREYIMLYLRLCATCQLKKYSFSKALITKSIPSSNNRNFYCPQIGNLFPVSDEETEPPNNTNEMHSTLPISSASSMIMSNPTIVPTTYSNNSERIESNTQCVTSNSQKSLSGAVAYLHSEIFKSLNKPETKLSSGRKRMRKRSSLNYQEIDHCEDDNEDETLAKNKVNFHSEDSSGTVDDSNVMMMRANCRNALLQLADTIDSISSEEFLGLITNNIDNIAMLCKSHVQKEAAKNAPVQESINRKDLPLKSKGRPPSNKPKRKYTKRNPSAKAVVNFGHRPPQTAVRLSSIKLIPLPGPPAMQPSTEISEDFILKPQTIKDEVVELPVNYSGVDDTVEQYSNGDVYPGVPSDPSSSFCNIPSEQNTIDLAFSVKEEYLDDI